MDGPGGSPEIGPLCSFVPRGKGREDIPRRGNRTEESLALEHQGAEGGEGCSSPAVLGRSSSLRDGAGRGTMEKRTSMAAEKPSKQTEARLGASSSDVS